MSAISSSDSDKKTENYVNDRLPDKSEEKNLLVLPLSPASTNSEIDGQNALSDPASPVHQRDEAEPNPGENFAVRGKIAYKNNCTGLGAQLPAPQPADAPEGPSRPRGAEPLVDQGRPPAGPGLVAENTLLPAPRGPTPPPPTTPANH
ncbi:hypothetical protein RhiJN_17495 [Ceratobasidium sp. AG-Ba]|nr:hypothetical protein RhiJN_17495 [Ceratobasidium sp. AG-Ba]